MELFSNPRDPLHDEPYAAAFAVGYHNGSQGLVEATAFGLLPGHLRENYFPSVPFQTRIWIC